MRVIFSMKITTVNSGIFISTTNVPIDVEICYYSTKTLKEVIPKQIICSVPGENNEHFFCTYLPEIYTQFTVKSAKVHSVIETVDLKS